MDPASSLDSKPRDDLTRIKGIGPKLSELCHSSGIKRFEQIASWTEEDIAKMDRQLQVKGRIERDRWVEQARELAAESSDEGELAANR